MPMTGFPRTMPRTTGLPGLMFTPWITTLPSLPITDAVKSSRPAEEPAFTTMMSTPATASSIAAPSSSASSRMIGRRRASAPYSTAMAESIIELKSMIIPRSSDLPGSTSSEPVGMTATRGRFRTITVLWPLASKAPMSTGRITWFSGRTSSVATMSSPTTRTCCQGVAGFRISISCSDIFSTSSIMITAFRSSGRGSPVSTKTACSGTRSRRGLVSVAPKVSLKRIATPSMAAE